MHPKFRETKAAELAAYLLRLRGGRMSYMKLIKLMYIVERRSLLRYGHPVTFDLYYSLDHGPILSRTKNLLCEGPRPGTESIFANYVSPPRGYDVELVTNDFEVTHLSDAEVALADEVFAEFGNWWRWDVRDYTHTLPEWQDPEGGSIEITYHDILVAGGVSVEEAHAIEEELDAKAFADLILG
jgi:uncharacterized phage-associated protein